MKSASRWRRWAADLTVRLTRRLSRAERIFFVSDLHLGDGSSADLFEGKDEAFIAFLDHVALTADKLVILGDALDFYCTPSFEKILRAHKRVLRRLKQLADDKEVLYVYGNHDEDVLLLEDLLNFRVVERLVLPPDTLVIHGHELDPYFEDAASRAATRWAATLHARVERLLGAWVRAPLATYDNKTNRAAHWLGYRLLRAAEMSAWMLERLGGARRAASLRRFVDYWNRSEQGDQQGLFREVVARIGELPCRTLVCGHSHQPGVVDVGDKTYVNTGTWTRELSTYVVWDGARFTCHDWVSGTTIGDELYRPFVDGHAPLPLKHWWRSSYRGWLRFRFERDPMALPNAS